MKTNHWVGLAAVLVLAVLVGGFFVAGGRVNLPDQLPGPTAEMPKQPTAEQKAQPLVQPAAIPTPAKTAEELDAEATKLREQNVLAQKELELKKLRAENETLQQQLKQPIVPATQTAQAGSGYGQPSPEPQTGSAAPRRPASPPAAPAAGKKFGSDAELFNVQRTPAGFTFDGVSDPTKARSCAARGGQLYRMSGCRKLENGQRECPLGCTADGPAK